MSKKTELFKGHLEYCTIINRPGDTPFVVNQDGAIVADLIGYTIIPSEQYAVMKSIVEDAKAK